MDIDLQELKQRLRDGVSIKDRSYLLKSYPKSFVGSEAVEYLVASNVATSKEEAVYLGNAMMQCGMFHHVTRDHVFRDGHYFYRFVEDDEDHGHCATTNDGESVSWAEFLPDIGHENDGTSLPTLPSMRERRHDDGEVAVLTAGSLDNLEVSPLDEHNVALLDNVHPVAWVDPQPPSSSKYNMVVVGGGTGGLVTAISAAGVGARVALIEKHLMGGDCLNIGCVPSKALLKCAKVAHQVRNAHKYGVGVSGDVSVDFGAIMERMRKLRAQISDNDSARRYTSLGVDVYMGHATFVTKNSVSVNGKTLEFQRACIATGGAAAVPNIPGLTDLPYYTNATLFNMTELPSRMAVIGAGPIGCEMAQAFQRFGCQVTIFARHGRILSKEDEKAAEVVQSSLEADGVTMELSARLVAFRKAQDVQDDGAYPLIEIEYGVDDETRTTQVEAVLVAIGRRPNVENMGLESAEVEYTVSDGIVVNDHLQTSQKHIYAVGDCCSQYQFTHMADFMARMVIRNALFYQNVKWTSLIVPWATYTDPEVAHVGLYERDLRERNIDYRSFVRPFEHVDRCILEGRTDGWVQVLVNGKGKILGATIVGEHAGDLISELTLALQHGITMTQLSTVIHPYPTRAEAIRQCGDMVNKGRLTPFVKGIFRSLMAFQRL